MNIPLAAWSALPTDEFARRLIWHIALTENKSYAEALAKAWSWTFTTEAGDLLGKEYMDELMVELMSRMAHYEESRREKKATEKNA